MNTSRFLPLLAFLLACGTAQQHKQTGSIERLDAGLDSIISADAQVEIIAEGFEWCEGPLWLADQQMLVFSDVMKNVVHKWTAAKGTEIYLQPSGYTGAVPRGEELGSNGLLLDSAGRLVLCQHGDRRLAVMNSPLDQPAPNFSTVADNYQGKRFNSPNDAVLRSDGAIFFTDPPYGLVKREKDSSRELSFFGVYKTDSAGVKLLVDSITRPNGIALSPDEKTLVVACSDPQKAIWYMFDIDSADNLSNARILYNATSEAQSAKGLPDGLKIDRQGNIFASGPGGIWIFNSRGRLLGKIRLPESASNCALADDERTLYITADMYLLRVKMR